MAIEIRKMSFGELFDRGIRIFFEYFKTFFLLLLVLAGPIQFAYLAISDSLATVSEGGGDDMLKQLEFTAYLMLLITVFSLINSFTNGVIARAIMDQVTEGRMRIGVVVMKVLKVFIPLVLTLLLIMIITGTAAGVLIIAAVFCVFIGPVGIVLSIFLGTAAIVVILYLTIVFALTPYTVVLEDKRYLAALLRSNELMRGFRGKYFLIMLLLGIASTIFTLMFGEVPAWMGLTKDLKILGWVLSAAAQMVFNVYYSIVITLFYIDIRVRKEGFDLAVLSLQPHIGPEGEDE